jgi:hypothetical protein
MKTRIALFALAAGALAIAGCAGSPVAVDRFGNMQPVVQAVETAADAGVVEADTRPLLIPNNLFSPFSLYGFNDLSTGRTPTATPTAMPAAFVLPYKPDGLTLFNGTRLIEKPLEVVFPYNQDASLTLYRFNNFQIKLMPMKDGRF